MLAIRGTTHKKVSTLMIQVKGLDQVTVKTSWPINSKMVWAAFMTATLIITSRVAATSIKIIDLTSKILQTFHQWFNRKSQTKLIWAYVSSSWISIIKWKCKSKKLIHRAKDSVELNKRSKEITSTCIKFLITLLLAKVIQVHSQTTLIWIKDNNMVNKESKMEVISLKPSYLIDI